jgi:rRNA-processing protein FCF1
VLVSPRPGVRREDLLEVLRRLQYSVVDARNPLIVADRSNPTVAAYLAWVKEAVKLLRNRVSAADLDRLVLTRRYWLLQSMVTDVAAPVDALVATEIDERETAFRETYDALNEQIQRWSRPGRFVVPDTSFYIEHPQKLDIADFAAELGARGDEIHLLVPIVVVDELDGLKKHNRTHTRWRARHTLAVLDRVLADGTGPARLRAADFSALEDGGIPRGEITVEIVFDPPGHARLPINDDEIIDRILAFQPLAGRDVTLLTYDTSQSTRARSEGVPVVKLDEPLGEEPAKDGHAEPGPSRQRATRR